MNEKQMKNGGFNSQYGAFLTTLISIHTQFTQSFNTTGRCKGKLYKKYIIQVYFNTDTLGKVTEFYSQL